jgi:hypothetical protein
LLTGGAYLLPEGVDYDAPDLYARCPASPVPRGLFRGILINVPRSVPPGAGVPLRGYLKLPYDYGGRGDRLVEQVVIYAIAASSLLVASGFVGLPGVTMDLPQATTPEPGLFIGKYFNPELDELFAMPPGRYFVYAALGEYVSNVATLVVEGEES